MPEVTSLEPWWIRWEAWWKNQGLYLRAMDAHGLFQYDARAHRLTWRGTLPAAGRRWEVELRWGPGTPFIPPSIHPVGCWSALHQLRDGSMCLSPPQRLEQGYCGVEDLGFWLGQAVRWFEGYAGQGWAVPKLEWILRAPLLPGPGYRDNWTPSLLIGLPPEFRNGPPGYFGGLRVAIPEKQLGLGIVTHWSSGDGRLQPSGLSPEELIEGRYLRYDGTWICPDDPSGSLVLNGRPRLFRDLQLDQQCHKVLRRSERLERRKKHPVLIQAIGCDAMWGEASRLWWFSVLDLVSRDRAQHALEQPVPDILEYVQHTAKSIANELKSWSGVMLDGRALDARRRASRPAELHQKLANAHVMLVGLGALGSEVAHVLTQEGVEQFFLADGDILFPGNVVRHRATLAEAGLSKGDAVARHIRRINPQADVQVQNKWFEELIPELQLLSSSRRTIVVGLTGDEGIEYALSDFCSRLKLPCLHAWMELDGRVLRLFRVAEDGDPTLLDVSQDPSRLPTLPRPPAAGPAEQPPPEQCAEVILPGAASDLHAAANFVARAILDVLTKREGGHNHWLFAPGGISERELEVPEALRTRFGVASFTLSRGLEPKQLIG